MVMRDRRLEVPYQPEEDDLFDSIGRGVRNFFASDRDPETGLTGAQARNLARAQGKKTYTYRGNEYNLPRATDMSLQPGDAGYYVGRGSKDKNLVAAQTKPAPSKTIVRPSPVMGSDKNVNVGTGRGESYYGPAKRATKPAVVRKPAGEYVAPSSVESAQTAGVKGLPGGPSGMAEESGSQYGRTTYFGETPELAAQVAQQMREGLFGEQISQEDWDAMTQRNKDASFYGRFKKGGSVKKKPVKKMAKGGSVSSASKRGDGCCQRGKTRGRMV